jgi:hypothetical protein
VALANLITPELVIEVAEAVEDYQITAQEFNSIITIITSIFMGVAIISLGAILTEPIIKGLTKETGIKTKEIAGVPIPIME